MLAKKKKNHTHTHIIPVNLQMGPYLSQLPNVTTWTTGFIKTIILFSEQLLKICHFHMHRYIVCMWFFCYCLMTIITEVSNGPKSHTTYFYIRHILM